jgi:hypothetical protein
MKVRAALALLLLAGVSYAERGPAQHRVPTNGKKVAQAPVVKVTCDVLEISATTGKEGSIDPTLKPVEKKLKQQPWSYNQYKQLSKSQKTLEKGKAMPLDLKDGSGTAKLVEIVDKTNVRLTVTEDHGGKRIINTTQNMAANDWLVVGHPVPPSKDGHLVAISCK